MEVVEIFVPLDESGERDASSAESAPALAARTEQALGWPRGAGGELRVVRRSLDARKKHAIGYRLRVEVARKGEPLTRGAADEVVAALRWPAGRPPPRVVVIGAGPAGTWAALRLVEAGIAPTIVEASRCSRAAVIWRCSRGEC